jgi:hypothetical protein
VVVVEAMVLVAASVVVHVVVAASAAVPVAEASEVHADSKQIVTGNQQFVSFCENNSDFACRCIIKTIPLQAKFESTVKWDK